MDNEALTPDKLAQALPSPCRGCRNYQIRWLRPTRCQGEQIEFDRTEGGIVSR